MNVVALLTHCNDFSPIQKFCCKFAGFNSYCWTIVFDFEKTENLYLCSTIIETWLKNGLAGLNIHKNIPGDIDIIVDTISRKKK